MLKLTNKIDQLSLEWKWWDLMLHLYKTQMPVYSGWLVRKERKNILRLMTKIGFKNKLIQTSKIRQTGELIKSRESRLFPALRLFQAWWVEERCCRSQHNILKLQKHFLVSSLFSRFQKYPLWILLAFYPCSLAISYEIEGQRTLMKVAVTDYCTLCLQVIVIWHYCTRNEFAVLFSSHSKI